MSKADSPIGVFAFNRPAHLQACLEAISRSETHLGRKLPLYIFVDAARGEGDKDAVEKTIAVARRWEGANVIVREKNLGFRNITEGITYLCNLFGRAIIIEDDVLIAPDFLSFICSALDRYENRPEVFMISGFMYFLATPIKSPTFFLPAPFIWGWATWKRAWDHFDWECKGWEQWMKVGKNRYFYDCLDSFPFSKGLRKTMEGKWTSWGTRWMYAVAKAGGLTLYPNRSLVWNCGCGGGTHGDGALDANPDLGEREFYIHGDMRFDDFIRPRLAPEVSEGKSFPSQVSYDKKALRSLAITFLKERLIKEKRKKWRLYLKLAKHRLISIK